jgi:hypothetical protein
MHPLDFDIEYVILTSLQQHIGKPVQWPPETVLAAHRRPRFRAISVLSLAQADWSNFCGPPAQSGTLSLV